MRTKDLATSMESWAAEVLTFNTYEHQPNSIAKALPLVLCEIQDDERAASNAQLTEISNFQQALVRGRVAELLLMIDPEPTWTASQILYDAVDDLAESIRRDSTLGGRVYKASPFYTARYTPPEVRHADGTIARVATFRVTVGELVEVG